MKSNFSGGKTVILNTLAAAQTQMGMKTSLYTVNPKAISVIELYGTLDPLTREYLILRLIERMDVLQVNGLMALSQCSIE